ncbi:MAG: transferase hexapeptide repeat family protein [Schleiferiaceae bacterium]|nr:transferase hexapeptide repeat family protein [Schleiferiaceae bacterium]
MACFEFNGMIPVVDPTAFVHPQANVTGDVIIGKEVYIGPGAVLRGDWGRIVVQDGCNVQENCVIHMFPGTTVTLEKGAHIGHGAIVHGATVGANSLIGMNAVLMDEVVIGKESIVGALCLVPTKTVVPMRSVVVGNPGKVVKQVSDEMLSWKTAGTALYQQLPKECSQTLKPCDPLHEAEAERDAKAAQLKIDYKIWKDTK